MSSIQIHLNQIFLSARFSVLMTSLWRHNLLKFVFSGHFENYCKHYREFLIPLTVLSTLKPFDRWTNGIIWRSGSDNTIFTHFYRKKMGNWPQKHEIQLNTPKIVYHVWKILIWLFGTVQIIKYTWFSQNMI